jgi:hypothetical protein
VSIVLNNLGPEIEAYLRDRAVELREEPADVVARLVKGILHPLQPKLEGEELRKYLQTLPKRNDFSDLLGIVERDPEFERALQSQRQVHPDDWK